MTIDRLISLLRIGDGKPSRSLEDLECLAGGALPGDYQEFIMRCNGGEVQNSVYYVKHDIVVEWVLGLHSEGHLSIFEHQSEIEDLPRGIVPIIADPFGNHVCLDKAGQVYFLDHENHKDPLRVISRSFTDFVEALDE